MKVALVLVTLIVLNLVLDTEGWWFWRRRRRTSSSCLYKSGTKPYYFGTTNLSCMRKVSKGKGKRSAPQRSTLSWSHRFIYFDGYYFEFGIGPRDLAVYGRSATSSDQCSSSRESSPAGYSYLSVDCLKRCTDRYKSRYGSYSLFFHNCHHFANRMSKILCNERSCPSWCA